MTVKCITCYKEFKDNYNLQRHKNRRNPCTQITQFVTHNHVNDIIYSSDIESDTCNERKCGYCGKIFSRKWSLYRHINSFCKEKRNDDNNKEKIMTELIRELEEKTCKLKKIKKEYKNFKKTVKTINNQTLNNNSHNTTNNTINNIKIVGFGKEDITHISDREWIKILKRNYKSIEDLTLKTHFDKNRPENHNIYISNLHSKYIMVHDSKNWNIKNRKDTVDDLYDEKAYIIFNKLEELTNDLPISIVDKFNEIKIGYDTEEIRKVLIKDLDMTLYNQRRIPIFTHKIKES